MDAISAERYEKKLLLRRSQLLASLRRLGGEKVELAGRRHFDWLDRAWDESEIKLLDTLDDMHTKEIGKVDVALKRILAGTYGLCKACHQRIPRMRLDAFPETEFCLSCQDLREAFEEA